MTKGDLINIASQSANITKKAAGEALQSMLDAITSSLKRKQRDNHRFRNFQSFKESSSNWS